MIWFAFVWISDIFRTLMFGAIILFPLILLFLSWYIRTVNRINDKILGTSELESRILDGNPHEVVNAVSTKSLQNLNEFAKEIVNRFVALYAVCQASLSNENHSMLLRAVSRKIFTDPSGAPVILQNEFGICYMWALTAGLNQWDSFRALQTFALIDKYLRQNGFQDQSETTRYDIIIALGVPEKHIMTAEYYST